MDLIQREIHKRHIVLRKFSFKYKRGVVEVGGGEGDSHRLRTTSF